MLSRRVTLQQIAAVARLSRSGVSRALQNDPRVPAETCRRVQAIARRLGYRPDPEVSAALRLLRQRRTDRYIETLAFFSWHEDRIERAGSFYTKRLYAGARACAEALGYHLEEVWVTAPRMTGERLEAVLASRGIRGCVVGPLAVTVPDFAFNWERFAVVAATSALPEIPLHRSLASNFSNAQLALAEAAALGYRRIGLLIDDYINTRSGGSIQGAYLNFQHQHPELAPLAIHQVRELGHDPRKETVASAEFARFAEWCRVEQPDVILSSRVVFLHWVRKAGLRVPAQVGFVSLEGVDGTVNCTHIDQNPAGVGAAGVRLLSSVLSQGGRAPPEERLSVLVKGRWVPGPTTVRQESGGRKPEG